MFCFADVCRFCKKSDEQLFNITSNISYDIGQIYKYLSKDRDAELNLCLKQICKQCFTILSAISDILLECERTDKIFIKYLHILKGSGNLHGKYSCVIRSEVTQLDDIKEHHFTIKKEEGVSNIIELSEINNTKDENNEEIFLHYNNVEDERNLKNTRNQITMSTDDSLRINKNIDNEIKMDFHSNKYQHLSNNIIKREIIEENNVPNKVTLKNDQDMLNLDKENEIKFIDNIHSTDNENSESYLKYNCDDVSLKQNNYNFENTHTNNHSFTYELYNISVIQSDLTHNVHTEECSFVCDLCKETFSQKDTLSQHKCITDERPFVCDDCDKSFYRKSHLDRHKIIHKQKRSFACDVCNKEFCYNRSEEVLEHIHMCKQSHICDICMETFRSNTEMIQHKLSHVSERAFKCDLCNKTYYHKSSLDLHKLIHNGR